jgi:membrane protein
MKNFAIKNINTLIITTMNVYAYSLINHAAALAFYFLLSIMPSFLLIIITAKKLLVAYPDFTLKILDYIESINPTLTNFINSTKILNTKGDVNYSYVGFFSLILAASLFYKALIRAFDVICKDINRGFITGFFIPYIYTMISAIFIIVITIIQISANIYINFLFDFIPFHIPKSFFFIIEGFFIPTVIVAIATLLTYYTLSFKTIGFKTSFYGSLLFSLLFYITNILFNKLYNPSFYNYLYGSIGYIIILLVWLYTAFILFLYFAAFSYNYSHYEAHLAEIANKGDNPLTLIEKIIIKLENCRIQK